MADRFGMEDPACPSCNGPLAIVEQTQHFLNSEQFDATKAGDYFCSKCPASAGQAGESKTTGYAYFWARQLQKVVEKTEAIYPLYSLCPTCGHNVKVDEDGCCVTCGADAMGLGIDQVHAALEAALKPCCATDHARVCDKPGCVAATIRRDDGHRYCAAGHPTRWCEVSERDAAEERVKKFETALKTNRELLGHLDLRAAEGFAQAHGHEYTQEFIDLAIKAKKLAADLIGDDPPRDD